MNNTTRKEGQLTCAIKDVHVVLVFELLVFCSTCTSL